MPNVTAYFGPASTYHWCVEGRRNLLIFEIPDREHGSGVGCGHARALRVAREGMSVTGTRGQRVEKVVV